MSLSTREATYLVSIPPFNLDLLMLLVQMMSRGRPLQCCVGSKTIHRSRLELMGTREAATNQPYWRQGLVALEFHPISLLDKKSCQLSNLTKNSSMSLGGMYLLTLILTTAVLTIRIITVKLPLAILEHSTIEAKWIEN
jgi:hypothetical protein